MEELQESILAGLQGAEPGASFARDPWSGGLGQGLSTVLAEGEVLEKACVNRSVVGADSLPPAATQLRPHLAGQPWAATGVSVVVHPRNPLVPASHMNVRHFCCRDPDGGEGGEGLVQWFGGGYDLTPSYPNEADARHWHTVAKRALDALDPTLYPSFKARCDEYFLLPHRGEMRGVGGVFFDDFLQGGFDHSFAVAQAVGESYLPAYLPLLEQHSQRPWTEQQRQWQLLRRGRYAEFNLALDRGTRFGLQSSGRVESILASLPPLARWEYGVQPPPDSPEAQLAEHLQPRDWAGEGQN